MFLDDLIVNMETLNKQAIFFSPFEPKRRMSYLKGFDGDFLEEENTLTCYYLYFVLSMVGFCIHLTMALTMDGKRLM